MTSTDFDDWQSPALLADPYAIFRELRAHDPVHWNPYTHVWVLTRHADVVAAMHDPRVSSVPGESPRFARDVSPDELAALGAVLPYLGCFMQGMDPPAHTRQRSLVAQAFTPRRIESLRPRISELTTAALDRAAASESFEWMQGVAVPIPVTVIRELMGIPDDGHDQVHQAAAAVAEFLALVDPAPGQLQTIAGRLQQFAEYLTPILAERRTAPQADLLSALVHAQVGGESLSQIELLVLTTMLTFAGHETTTNLLGNGMLALAAHPTQWQHLRAQPELVGPAVEEMLRFDPPVQMVPRWVREPLSLGDKQLLAGQRLLLNFAAANRDPAVVADPDDFNITRAPVRHIAFGHGLHYCLGAALARLEAQVVFSQVAARFSQLDFDPAQPPVRKPNIPLRGPKTLHLKLQAGAAALG